MHTPHSSAADNLPMPKEWTNDTFTSLARAGCANEVVLARGALRALTLSPGFYSPFSHSLCWVSGFTLSFLYTDLLLFYHFFLSKWEGEGGG
ncbi:unnamed protein product [Rodentolepis nana]|uniref:Uncharacterized protein n=1 Tax=Rodentolepis nana TaxID=102285 RepID=A0A0R3TRL8_RODNA|nr:unnamed protein product [Rodentolepis nana]